MHHPGPPRFVGVEETVELAPRDPDPTARYSWTIERAPQSSTATVGDDPVEHLTPDVPGRYVAALEAPDGVHRLTIRCFPGPPTGERTSGGRSGHHSGTLVAAAGRDAEGESGYGGTGQTGDHWGDGGRPRVRLDGRIEDDDLVVTADPRPHPTASETADSLDVAFVVDDRDDLDRSALTVEGQRLRIPIDRLPERVRIHGVAVGEDGHSVADMVDVRRAGDGDVPLHDQVSVERPYDPPAWATDAVYYEVYVRTFAPEADHGETLSAITDRLDHLANLGVDAVWLTPVLEKDHADHGYNITDFFSIAADLGDREDLAALVDAAHERDMKVLFDLVLNHSAREHPYFQDAYDNPDSDYREWYDWQESGEPETYFDWPYIANFDFGSLSVRRHLLDAVETWAPMVDGFRCDMAWAVPNAFWREVHDRVKARDADFLLLDETIPYVADFQEGLFDVHFDSTTYAALRSVGTGWDPAESILDAVDQRRAIGFPEYAGFLLYAENHDETRYIVDCGRPAAMAVAGALCTLPGAPLVYAGQELGQQGKRDDIAWEHADDELTDHYRRLLATRRSVPALQAGAALERVEYEVEAGEPDRVVAFARAAETTDGEATAEATDGEATTEATDGEATAERATDPRDATACVVVCHFGDGAATVSLAPSTDPVDAVTGRSLSTSGEIEVEDVVVLPAEPSVGRDGRG